MRVLQINSVCGIRSTGRICTDFAEEYIADGHEVKIAYGREIVPEKYQHLAYRIGTNLNAKVNALAARLLDNEGFNAKKQTAEFLKWAEEYNPDLLWLHNLHGYYINIEMLFEWIKSRPQMQVKWLLHDCWAFTGHCAYFTMVGCNQWKTGCEQCAQKNAYPRSLLWSKSNQNFSRKKTAFVGVKNMTLITPSHWLADLVKQSFLKKYNVEVRHNTIDTSVFKPTPSDFRKRYDLEDKIMVLGVASAWSKRKGLDDFIKLSEMLDDSYAIVLVGLTETQIKKIPEEITCISRTNSTKELAEIYTAADVFVNPSREETFGLTTIEALSCGTMPIVYKDTACEEVVDTYGGIAVSQDIESLQGALLNYIETNRSRSTNRCKEVTDDFED